MHHLELRPDEGHRILGEVRHLRQPDEDHLGDPRHQGHRHQPDADHQVGSDLVDPCPAKVRTGYCLGVLLGEECPCPDLKQMDCCLGGECLAPAPEGLELVQQQLEHRPRLAFQSPTLRLASRPCLV